MRLATLVIGTSLFGATLFGAACAEESVATDPAWKLDHVESSGALLSVWGSGPNDVWAAGGQVGHGLVLHNDGSEWTAVDTGANELLWWIYGFQPDDVYAVGEGGLILHYDGVSWQRAESGTDTTLYGVWGASGDDVWVVGGDASGPAGSAVVLRGSGTSFEVVDDLPAELTPSALFKAYGGPQGLIAVGSGGTVLRFDGETWTQDEAPTTAPIFSLWGRSDDDVYAVGGYGTGEILHWRGDEWHKVHDSVPGPGLSGVFTAPDQPMIAVGPYSYVLEIDPDGTEVEPLLPYVDPMPSLHGVWGDGTGTTYAVGGDLFSYPGRMTSGVIFRRN